jgi:hypothetical protein
MLFKYILGAAMVSVTLAVPYYEPPSLTKRQACAGMNLNCTCRCTCGEGVSGIGWARILGLTLVVVHLLLRLSAACGSKGLRT